MTISNYNEIILIEMSLEDMDFEIEKNNLTIMEIRLRELREKKGITQFEVAMALDINRSLLSIWENGYANISLKQLIKLAAFYHVPIDYILGMINEIDNHHYLYIKTLDLKYVGIKIREIRKKENLTQDKFAEMLYTKRSNISYYEIGKMTISTADLKGICETFGVSADYITGNTLEFIKRKKKVKVKAKEIKALVNS